MDVSQVLVCKQGCALMHSFVYMFITTPHGVRTIGYAVLESSDSVCTVWIRMHDVSLVALAVCIYTELYENLTFGIVFKC